MIDNNLHLDCEPRNDHHEVKSHFSESLTWTALVLITVLLTWRLLSQYSIFIFPHIWLFLSRSYRSSAFVCSPARVCCCVVQVEHSVCSYTERLTSEAQSWSVSNSSPSLSGYHYVLTAAPVRLDAASLLRRTVRAHWPAHRLFSQGKFGVAAAASQNHPRMSLEMAFPENLNTRPACNIKPRLCGR